jgi:beta-galactosidase
MFYYLQSWWTDQPVLHIFPHWNWKDGQAVNVWAYSNCDEVELFLNKKSLGRKTMPINSHIEWPVNFEPGTLSAWGYKNNKEIITDTVETIGEPSCIKLTSDRSTIKADGEDVSMITVAINDTKGRLMPTANNEITFSLLGPGKIIGVGNGDPSSHEPDKYVEQINQIRIQNLKTQTMLPKKTYPEISMEYNDSTWQPAVNGKGEYTARRNDTVSVVVIRGEFILPEITKETTISLWPKSLGEEQSMYINGHPLVKNIKRDDAVHEYTIERSIVHKGKNIYAIVGTPLVKRFQYDNLNTDPGILQVSMPADSWKRKTFNGLAQVIIQASKESGVVILKANSNGLTADSIQILSQKSVVRPSVPE